MVLHVELVVLEEIQVDPVPEMSWNCRNTTEVVVVVLGPAGGRGTGANGGSGVVILRGPSAVTFAVTPGTNSTNLHSSCRNL